MLPRFAITRSAMLGRVLPRQTLSAARPLPSAFPSLKASTSIATFRASQRYYAPAPRLREQDDDEEIPEQPRTDVPARQSPGIDGNQGTEPGAKKVDLIPFETLNKQVNYDTLKALTFKPFCLVAMSEVQRRVLTQMPYLIGGRMKRVRTQNEVEVVDQEPLAFDDSIVDDDDQKSAAGKSDLLVKAKTGTGKTIAFLVPAIDSRLMQLERLKREKDEDGQPPTRSMMGQNMRRVSRSHVGALIISPTRELATQIANEALKVHTWHKQFQTRLLVGGMSRLTQLREWRRGRKDIVVATPGRLVDLLGEYDVREALGNTEMLILDEADTLLEMGFSKDLKLIMDAMPKTRQTFMFSATVSRDIAQLAGEGLKKGHQFIDCVPKNESNVHQHVPQYQTILPSEGDQLSHVLRLISHDQLLQSNSKVILFLPTTKLTMLYATFLRELTSSLPRPLAVHEIHSKLDQNQRSRASDRFRRDTEPSVLVTSDVSARGVDYPNVTRVIQVGIPSSASQYIHRVGRTGRAGKEGGRGDLVLQPWEAGFVQELRGIPIKPLQTEVLSDEISAAIEAQGNQTAAGRLAMLDQKVQELMPSLDARAIEEVYTSMLGYYLSKQAELRSTTEEIVEGLKRWSVKQAGLVEPPYLSPSFMLKLGIGKSGGSRTSGGYRSGGGDGRGYVGRPGSYSGGGGGYGGGGYGGRSGRSGDFGDRDSNRAPFRPRDGGFGPRGGSDGGYSRGGSSNGGYSSRGGSSSGGYNPRASGDDGFGGGGDRGGSSGFQRTYNTRS